MQGAILEIYKISIYFFIGIVIGVGISGCSGDNDQILYYIAKPQKIHLYWKDESSVLLQSIDYLRMYVERKQQYLQFAMNAGMFDSDFSPHGLFIQNQQVLSPLDTLKGVGNFYLSPNGVFYLTTDNMPIICKTSDFVMSQSIKYATQSGPMLIIEGEVNPIFKEGSANITIRNGVGILPDNRVLFALSKRPISFYDFAQFFKQQGCTQALYLDGFVSQAYFPAAEWIQTDGKFGVMIGVIE